LTVSRQRLDRCIHVKIGWQAGPVDARTRRILVPAVLVLLVAAVVLASLL
jgi:hypothetical protein